MCKILNAILISALKSNFQRTLHLIGSCQSNKAYSLMIHCFLRRKHIFCIDKFSLQSNFQHIDFCEQYYYLRSERDA